MYEDFSYLLFSVLKWRREHKSVPYVVNVEVAPRGRRGIKRYMSEVFTIWQRQVISLVGCPAGREILHR